MRRTGKRKAAVLLLLSIVLLISGCFGNKPVPDELSGEGNGKLKVYYPYVEDFHIKYGQLFNSQYPDIEIEVIQSWDEGEGEPNELSPLEKLQRMIERQKPDVLVLNLDEYDQLSSMGKLYDLESAFKQEQFDLDGYAPGLIDMLRERGNGSLFGLAPTLRASFLYYNADMFKDMHIDPPVDKMPWKELFELAARFHNGRTDEDTSYGLMDNEASDVLRGVAAAMNLQLFDAEGKQVMLQSEGWKQAFQLTADAIRNKAVSVRPPQQDGEPGSRYILAMNKFVNGELPMIINDSSFAAHIGGSSKMNWGMVTAPIDPARVDESASTYATQIFAIAADSTNKRDAWELVKFMNGAAMAKVISRNGRSELPARTGYIPRGLERGAESIYMLKPAKHRANEPWKKNIPESFYEAYSSLVNEALQSVTDNEQSVDEALAELQQKAQVELELARRNR
ncbi:ABC transporter substrate-binding protein [Paenibacillus sp. OSY-SE]|uniref:ABC transporter substrate-binding protein n=1 Tax=Paenibacillus sp. OSY-SE TaxID=1196323 RepID=UPI0002F7C5CE|nr:extracellular solute-binding protein [Paenibacillus sp. OSY-SE]